MALYDAMTVSSQEMNPVSQRGLVGPETRKKASQSNKEGAGFS
jgi:hypothetical protein